MKRQDPEDRLVVNADSRDADDLAWPVGPSLPLSIRSLNALETPARERLYHRLVPPSLVARLKLDPQTMQGPRGSGYVRFHVGSDGSTVTLSIFNEPEARDPCLCVELADNSYNGIDLNLIVINDPAGPRFGTDLDERGNATFFGTVTRNLAEEERALRAGLAPGQIRPGLHLSRSVLRQVEAFLTFCGHETYCLDPLTYTSAWLFERLGFSYLRGHALMVKIDQAFLPGGRLHHALDNSTVFRAPDAWQTVRGRAWAIHDGILEVLDERWDNLRMLKLIGQDARLNTFPGAAY